MARRSKEERKKAIDEHWMSDVPPLGLVGSSMFLAVRLAKLMIDHEEMVGLGDPISQETFDWDAATRKAQQEARWAAMERDAFQRSGIKTGDVAIKVKRKVSAYSKLFGIELKKLIKKHPRTKVKDLMKRAHTQTKKKMPKKKGRLSKGRRVIAKSGQFRRDKILPRKR